MRQRRAAPSDISQWDCEMETSSTEDNDKVGRFHQSSSSSSSFLPLILVRLRYYYYSSAPKRNGWQKLLQLLLLLFVVGGFVATAISSFSRWGMKSKVSSSSTLSSSYQPIQQTSSNTTTSTTYDVFDCPATPPLGYPREYPILDVLTHWKTDNVDHPPSHIYQGICVFD
jgi:hypothetical protein